jgi:hypothetical protein
MRLACSLVGLAFSLFTAATAFVACDSSPVPGSEEDLRPDLCVGVGATACAPAVEVATAEGLAALIDEMRTSSGRTLDRPSKDVRFTADVEIAGEEILSARETCSSSADAGASAPWMFHDPQGLPGITCLEAAPGLCRRVRLAAGTVVRFRKEKHHDCWVNGRINHTIGFAPPCAEPCRAGTLRCEASESCVDVRSFCAVCEGAEPAACLCRSGCRTLEDGTECSGSTSDDTVVTGACRSGVCE